MFKINTFNGRIEKLNTNEYLDPPYDDPMYLEYADWVNQGNNAETYYQVIEEVPEKISRLQAKAVLSSIGLLTPIEEYMASEAAPILAKLAWSEAQEFRRSSPLVSSIATMYSLTEQQLDELFIEAGKIEV